MNAPCTVRPLVSLLLTGLIGLSSVAQAQSGNTLLISTDERCAINRVNDESLPLAVEACRELAESGDMQAQFEMGEFHFKGDRTDKNIPQALAWYEQASIQGHPGAQYQLGLMHYQGEGVERNLPQAYIILKMAAVNGKDAAMDVSDQIALQMNAQELAVATQVLGTLFRNYLTQIREEQLQSLQAAPLPESEAMPAQQPAIDGDEAILE